MINKFKISFTTIILLTVTIITFAQQDKYVIANELNVREGAGKEFVSLGKVYEGDVVTVLSENESWAKISFNNGTAYVSAQYLSDVKEISQKTNSTDSTGKVWILLGCAVIIIIGSLVYRKFCLDRFSYDIFNLKTLIYLAIPFGVIIYFLYSENNEIIGLSKTAFSIILFFLTIIGLYLYNFKKTNWYFAIFNVIIQTIAVGVFVVIVIGRIILKILGSSSSIESTTSTQANTSNPSISIAVQRNGLVYVYDEKNREIFTKWGNLHSYTSSTISIREKVGSSNLIRVYDIKGREISSHWA